MHHSILFLLIFTVLQAAANSIDPAITIRCLLLKDYQKSCNVLGGHPVPSHLIQIFQELPQETRKKLESNAVYWNLTANEYALIHPSFWLLTSTERLSKFPGSKLSSVVLHWPNDSSVTAQVMNSLRTTDQRKDFISGLNPKSTSLSERVQSVISAALINWDEGEWDLPVLVHNANSLLLHFPAEYLLISSRTKSSERLLFFVTSWEGFGDNKKWMEQPAIIRRKVAHVFLSNSHRNISEWSETDLQKFGHLIPGMTAEELSHMRNNDIKLTAEAKRNIMNLGDMDIQQIRTLFDVFYSETRLTKNYFAGLVPIVTKLSPDQLNKFHMKKFNFKEVTGGDSMKELPSLKQLLQMSIASSVLNNNRSLDVSKWGDEVKYLGPMIAALPLDEFKLLSEHKFDEVSLSLLEYPVINFVQAYYLTRQGRMFDLINPKLFTLLHHLLQALPSATIINYKTPQVSSRSWADILSALSGNNAPRFVLLYQHVESMGMDDSKESLLRNEENYPMLGLLPSRNLESIAAFLSKNLENFKNIRISLLPKVLTTLVLNLNRSGPWTWENFMSKQYLNMFLIGITCSDVYNIETSDFPLIMAEYNKQRITAGLVFPKELQFCCQQKLMKYLEMKSRLLQDEPKDGLMSLLEPGEIEALGGYILASLPPKAISSSNYRSQILKLIGQLSVPEIMVGISETQRSEIINIFFDHHGLNEDSRMQIDETHLFHMGNLTLFLPEAAIKRIKPEALKLLMEINFIDKRVCADNATRNQWANLIRSAFGEPKERRSERLTIIGDFLLVLSDSEFSQIKQEAMQGAGVALSNNFGEMVDWVPENTEYYKACVSTLNGDERTLYMNDLKKLVRFQLKAVQLELNTVKSASEIIKEITSSPVLQQPLERPIKFNYSTQFLQPQMKSAAENISNITTNESRKLENLKVDNASMRAMGEGLFTTALPPISTLTVKEVTPTTPYPRETTDDSQHTKIYPMNLPINTSNSQKEAGLVVDASVLKRSEQSSGRITESLESTTHGLMPEVVNKSGDSDEEDDPSKWYGDGRRISLSGGPGSNFDKNIQVLTTMKPTSISSTTQKFVTENSTNQKPTTEIFTTQKPFEPVTESLTTTTKKMPPKKPDPVLDIAKLIFPFAWGSVEESNSDKRSSDNNSTSQNATAVNSSVSINSSYIVNPDKIIANENSTQVSMQKRSSDDIYDKSVHPDSLIGEDASPKAGDDDDDEEEEDDDMKLRRRRNVIVDSTVGENSAGKKEAVQEEITISCDSMRVVGEISKLAFEVSDLEKFTNRDVENCLDVFREIELPLDMKRKILKRISKEDLSLLGSLLQASQVEDLKKMRFGFNEPWVLETLSHLSSHLPEEKTIDFILQKVKEHNAKAISDKQIGPEVLISLKGLICHMSREDRRALLAKPKELKLATAVLGKIDNVSTECLKDLAEFAKYSMGDPKTYIAEDLLSLGVIAAGLDNEDWKNLLDHEGAAISELHPSAVKYMSKEKLEIIPGDIFHLIPYKTLRVLESAKYSNLKDSQKVALTNILNGTKSWEEKLLPKSSGDSSESDDTQEASYSSIYIVILLFIFILVCIYIFCRMRSR
ncbi:hypothetical protein LSTR_LSTR009151 [Laodelphax striatellus]|uniref:Uncharacterized protein n=1 Tax=Laodelphax striatellus TaxID=195883 RepID=A0A482XSB5_LAOST|nr:hypothetical protein LSTR_LSTR009151 [Laodelphax striatellus]